MRSIRTGQVRPELRANTSTSGSLTAHSKEFLRRTAEPLFRTNVCNTELFEIRTTGGEVRVIRDKLRSETALTASASLRGSDGIGKMARLLGALRPCGRPIAGSRQESGGGREPADELSFRYISVLKDLLLYRGKSGGVVSMAGNLGNLKQSAVQVPTPKRSICCHQRFFVAGCDRRAKSPHG